MGLEGVVQGARAMWGGMGRFLRCVQAPSSVGIGRSEGKVWWAIFGLVKREEREWFGNGR